MGSALPPAGGPRRSQTARDPGAETGGGNRLRAAEAGGGVARTANFGHAESLSRRRSLRPVPEENSQLPQLFRALRGASAENNPAGDGSKLSGRVQILLGRLRTFPIRPETFSTAGIFLDPPKNVCGRHKAS